MNDRVSNIIGNIRLLIGDISGEKYQNVDLYDKINLIQTQIMLRTKCVENNFQIMFSNGVEFYPFIDFNALLIKDIFTSWDGELIYVTNNEWKNYRQLDGDSPQYITIFANQLFFSPIPSNSTDSVTIWYYQTAVIDGITDDNEPETPLTFDFALIYGVAALYKPELLPLYEQQINLINSNAHSKISGAKQIESNW